MQKTFAAVYVKSCHEVFKFDPLDMLHNFCFHVYAQNSLYIGDKENNVFKNGIGV